MDPGQPEPGNNNIKNNDALPESQVPLFSAIGHSTYKLHNGQCLALEEGVNGKSHAETGSCQGRKPIPLNNEKEEIIPF